MKKKHVALIGAIALVGGVIQAHAATVSLTGDNVIFTFDDSQLGLLGEPLLVGDTLVFLPTAFVAEALNDDGISATGQTNNILVTAKGGQTLSKLDLKEEGSYKRVEDFGGGPTAVNVTGKISAMDTSNPANTVDDNLESNTDFSITGFFNDAEDWNATAKVDLGNWDSMEVNITIQNVLAAVSFESGDLARIEKTRVGLEVTTIPLPNAIILFGFALSSLLLTVNRTRG